MPPPLETIKAGILAGDWKKVAAGYKRLTGEAVKPPPSPRKGAVTVSDVPPLVRGALLGPVRDLAQQICDLVDATVLPGVEEVHDADRELQEEEEEEANAFPPSPDNSPLPAEPPPPPASGAGDGPPEPDPPAAARRRPTTEDFRVPPAQPGGQTDGGGHPCRVLPHQPPTRNAFKDDGKLEKRWVKHDRKAAKARGEKETRPEARLVKVACGGCDRKFDVAPEEAPHRIEGEESTYLCQNCIRKRHR